ncbi:hypothetical protein OPQ81_010145 [Rhizoctonia solani]|nr:hypothetical protein OPQ81_010145 [Rhizoctonia solani]
MTLGTLNKSRATTHIRLTNRLDVLTTIPSPPYSTCSFIQCHLELNPPPLESTGEHRPIGAADKKGEPLKEGVKDTEQRAAYFGGQKQASDVPNAETGVSDEAVSGAQKAAEAVELGRH